MGLKGVPGVWVSRVASREGPVQRGGEAVFPGALESWPGGEIC